MKWVIPEISNEIWIIHEDIRHIKSNTGQPTQQEKPPTEPPEAPPTHKLSQEQTQKSVYGGSIISCFRNILLVFLAGVCVIFCQFEIWCIV